mgnify:CR=1 FL=1|jgi:hypothetical protein
MATSDAAMLAHINTRISAAITEKGQAATELINYNEYIADKDNFTTNAKSTKVAAIKALHNGCNTCAQWAG